MSNDSDPTPPVPPPMVVLGTVNHDFVVSVDRHPQPGETLLGASLMTGTGGKGSNQAVAAARAGGHPILVAAVGDDFSGNELMADLEKKGVDITHVVRRAGVPTGVALITVAKDGENTIVVAAGAGSTLEPSSTAELVSSLVKPHSVLLAQLEVPLPAIVASAQAAHARGARFVLNLSPYIEVPESLLEISDPLIVNEAEGEAVSGQAIETPAEAENAARILTARSRSVVITLGGDGVVVADASSVRHLPARKVPVVDTTGAGDSFAGALAAALATGETLDRAVELGIWASSMTVQHLGAQPPPGFVGV